MPGYVILEPKAIGSNISRMPAIARAFLMFFCLILYLASQSNADLHICSSFKIL